MLRSGEPLASRRPGGPPQGGAQVLLASLLEDTQTSHADLVCLCAACGAPPPPFFLCSRERPPGRRADLEPSPYKQRPHSAQRSARGQLGSLCDTEATRQLRIQQGPQVEAPDGKQVQAQRALQDRFQAGGGRQDVTRQRL